LERMSQNSIYLDLLQCDTFVQKGNIYSTRVITAGEGPPLVLMHGGGGHAEAYSRNISRLATKHRVIAMDFLWHGFSSKPKFRAGNWLEQFSEQVLDLLDSMGIEKASLEGESLGGWVAIDLALRFPERVDKVILNTAWGCKFDPQHVREAAADLESLRKTSMDALNNPEKEKIRKRMEWLMSPEKVTDEIVDVRHGIWSRPDTNAALKEYYEQLFSPSTEDYLFDEAAIKRISVPTLILWTDKNPLHGIDAAHRLEKLIMGSRCYIIKNAAHWPQWEHAQEHDRVVLEFLGG
jgi:2-hydroxy-6-oxonona-2,4-dienedioate hydrolase